MKQHTVKSAKARAWKYFSAYIRKRDPRCVTCGAPTTQAGHFWHNVLDFDEENVNGQDVRCNHFLSGNLAVYSVYLLKKLGKKKFDALDIRHTKAIGGEKRTVEELLAIGDKYKALVDN
jgi:hypothetical protein